MTDMRSYTATAIILRARDYGEGHRLFALFTREYGKIVAVAKGVKKPRARLASALQPFTLGEVQFATGKRFDVITEMRVRQTYYGLRGNLDAFIHACYLTELFDASLDERQEHPEMFDLLEDVLRRLADGEAHDLVTSYAEITLSAMLGYLPYLTECARCATALARCADDGGAAWPTWVGFSNSLGGALCPQCLPMVPGARRVAAGTVQVMSLLLARGVDALAARPLSDRLRREVAGVLREYLEYRLEHRMRSAQLLGDWHGGMADTAGDAATCQPPIESLRMEQL